MLHPIQALLWILFLQHFATPVFGVRIIGSPVFRTLEASPELPQGDLVKLPTEAFDDKFDAYQEPFADGITSFDDDFKEYVDDKFVDIEFDLTHASDSRIPGEIIAKKPETREPEKATEELDVLLAESPLTSVIGSVEAVPKPIAESLFTSAVGLVEAVLEPIVEAELRKVELEQTPTEYAPTSEPLIEAKGQSVAEAEPAVGELEPTQDDFAFEGRGPGLFNQICKSREFQPTLENWWISGADHWLKDYTAENRNSPAFRAFGLVGSVAKKYLPAADFECKIASGGGFRPDKCRVSCVDIVARVRDTEEAKKVFFVLAGVVGLAERVGGIYNAVGQVAQDVAVLARGVPKKAGLNTPADAIGRILFNSIDSTLFAASPWIPTAVVFQSGNEALRAAKHFYDMAVQASSLAAGKADPYKWDKIFDSSYEMSLAEIDFTPRGYADGVIPEPEGMEEDTWHGRAVLRTRRALEDARALVAAFESGDLVKARNEGFQLFKELFAYSPNHPRRAVLDDFVPDIEGILNDAAGKARILLEDVLAVLLRGDGSSADGTTNLSKLLRYGHYLPSEPEGSNFKKANIAEIIARDVFMELFDNSLRQQPVYISCTEDKQRRADPRTDAVGPRVDTCNRDNTGPQNLKACFGNLVCYLYEWNERPMSHMSRNREPEGHLEWDEKPWNIEPQDIILSSVATHLSKDFVPKDIAEEADYYYQTATLENLRSPRAADHFKVPVCMSVHNWNTRLDGWNTFCDTSKHCTAKNLPCQCGPSGKDTRSLWEEIGLWNSPEHNYYSATLCPRQIQKKISDPLERYVAYCNLGIKRRGSGGNRVDGTRRYQGRDKYCDIITKAVESQKNGLVSDLDPETRFMLLCQIQNGGRGCGMYQSTFDNLQLTSGIEKGGELGETAQI